MGMIVTPSVIVGQINVVDVSGVASPFS